MAVNGLDVIEGPPGSVKAVSMDSMLCRAASSTELGPSAGYLGERGAATLEPSMSAGVRLVTQGFGISGAIVSGCVCDSVLTVSMSVLPALLAVAVVRGIPVPMHNLETLGTAKLSWR